MLNFSYNLIIFIIPLVCFKISRKLLLTDVMRGHKSEPYRISEFREFADEIPPTEVRHPESGRIVGVVDRLTLVTVIQQPSGH